MGELSGKVAIVTGASKGIGAAIARRFGEAGAAVAVNYASDKAGADRVVEQIKRDGGKAVSIQANVSKSADVKRLFAETKAMLGVPAEYQLIALIPMGYPDTAFKRPYRKPVFPRLHDGRWDRAWPRSDKSKAASD